MSQRMSGNMFRSPETRFSRLTLVLAALAAIVVGSAHMYFLGGRGPLEARNYWLKADQIGDEWVVDIIQGKMPQKAAWVRPMHCHSNSLSIFSTEPLDPKCVEPARDPCPESYAASFIYGIVIGVKLVCKIETQLPVTENVLPLRTEAQLIWLHLRAYAWSASAMWGPSLFLALLAAAVVSLSLFTGRKIRAWIDDGRK